MAQLGFGSDKQKLKLRPGFVLSSDNLKLQNLEWLGRGGNGTVHRMLIIEGALRGLIVAVKFLEIQHGERLKRFQKEIEILKSVEHPHVIKIRDVGSHSTKFGATDAMPFFVMEYQSRNLERELKAHPGGLHPDIVLPIGLQMASALTALHSHKIVGDDSSESGIVHRDLKPSNVLFDGTNVKIADFGIARLVGDEQPGTPDGQKVAPRFHMSPEQYRWWKGETTDPKEKPGKPSDIYQLGLILYQLLRGFNPNTVAEWWTKNPTTPAAPALPSPTLPHSSAIPAPAKPPATLTPGGTRKMAVDNVWKQDGSLPNDVSVLIKEMLSDVPVDRPTAEAVQERLLGIFMSYSSHYAALYGVQPGREF